MPIPHVDKLFTRKSYTQVKGSNSTSLGYQPGWRPIVLIWTCVTAVVLLINIILLIWSIASPPITTAPEYHDQWTDTPSAYLDGTKVLFQGDCQKATTIKTWSHLAINVASTILLLASSNAMQCLSAPTRQELDDCHAKGRRLDIGILSARNLLKIPVKRSIPWCLLAISSVPLHLFYNSVVFSSLATNEILTLVVSNDFTTSNTLNTSTFDTLTEKYADPNNDFIAERELRYVGYWVNAAKSLLPTNATANPQTQHMDSKQCIQTFSSGMVSNYKSVALVLSLADTAQIIDGQESLQLGEPESPRLIGKRRRWTCYDPNKVYKTALDFLNNCDESCPGVSLPGGPQDNPTCIIKATTLYWNYYMGSQSRPLPSTDWTLTGCYAEKVSDLCSIALAPSLLGIVIAANIVKVAIMLYTWRFLAFEPLVTVGDAVDSFLSRPDRATQGAGPRSAENTRDLKKSLPAHSPPGDSLCTRDRDRVWQGRRLRWASALSKARWITSIGMCLTIEAAGVILLIICLQNGPLSRSLEAGFGGIDTIFSSNAFNESFGRYANLLELTLLSNLPQLVVSMASVLYYTVIGIMLLTAETSAFSKTRRSLRVSPPRHGQQRSSYYLTLPLRYAVPLLVAFTVLHWFISQCVFLLRVDLVGYNGDVRYAAASGLGFSPVAIIASLLLGGLLILFPLLLSRKRLPGGMPLMAYNSLAISAACHPDHLDVPDAGHRPLMYGVLPSPGERGMRRVGFSSLEVEPLVDGEAYESTRCVFKILEPHDTTHTCTDILEHTRRSQVLTETDTEGVLSGQLAGSRETRGSAYLYGRESTQEDDADDRASYEPYHADSRELIVLREL